MNQYETISRAIEYLVKHSKAQPSLEELASHLHLSPESVTKMFRDWAGVTPKQFSRYLTLEYAKQVLQESKDSQLRISETL
jgi:AraC family transcriptional regulator, regulatory protein of adaptative response / methylated-DNA-[protein]-cysteine methyltransferase